MDSAALQRSWALVARHGDAVPSYFYAILFTAHPELRSMFPMSMSAQRDRLVNALGVIVSNVDNVEAAVPFVEGLGRDHRRFDVAPEHYPHVGEALLATLAYFLREEWTPELAADWTAAYELVSGVMVKAAEQAAASLPPYWTASVVEHEQRGFDVAVLRLQPELAYPYVAGQSCAIEIPDRPRLWRYYSPANVPRPDGLIEFHVKAVPGGQVSTAMVYGLQPGDKVKLGAPVGQRLTLQPGSNRDLLLIAGGTGLAPMKALVDQIAAGGGRRHVALFVGARTQPDLYDLPALEAMSASAAWLTVVPALSNDPWHGGEQGLVVDVALRRGRWNDRDVYVCGSAEMVGATCERLLAAGIPAERIRREDYTDDPYRPTTATAVTALEEVSAR
ncbi:globin domain-containing protein [Planosporangium sp. 12N6]|uniref:globin domain-containing protein n=1 Tax=Planosporangium spinosum TaxID=3402278 RepID=UPI003CF0ED6B